MNRLKVLASICMGTLVYVLISLFGGQGGLLAMAQLEGQKAALNSNVSEIQKINDTLSSERDGLKDNNEVIAGYAKKLGFISDNEKLIKVNGLGRKYNQVYETGSIVKRYEITFIPEWICKIFGMSVFALSLLLFYLLDLSISSKKRKTIDQSDLSNQNIAEYEVIEI